MGSGHVPYAYIHTRQAYAEDTIKWIPPLFNPWGPPEHCLSRSRLGSGRNSGSRPGTPSPSSKKRFQTRVSHQDQEHRPSCFPRGYPYSQSVYAEYSQGCAPQTVFNNWGVTGQVVQFGFPRGRNNGSSPEPVFVHRYEAPSSHSVHILVAHNDTSRWCECGGEGGEGAFNVCHKWVPELSGGECANSGGRKAAGDDSHPVKREKEFDGELDTYRGVSG